MRSTECHSGRILFPFFACVANKHVTNYYIIVAPLFPMPFGGGRSLGLESFDTFLERLISLFSFLSLTINLRYSCFSV